MSEATLNNDVGTELTTEVHRQPVPSALADLRAMSMSVDPERMQAGLAQYKERRNCFRDWLRAQLVEGVHYGYPPGCEPKYDKNGNLLVWMKGGDKAVAKEQWQAKPSLYKAGADFVCDLMGVEPKWEADLAAWQQLGSPAGTFVLKCQLFSKATKEFVGEGRGVRRTGQKGGDDNNAIKMAQKSAKVDAVLNAYGLSDLFTQDTEDAPERERHDNPEQEPSAPRAQPRGERVTGSELKAMYSDWETIAPDPNPENFADWVHSITGEEFDVLKAVQWTRTRATKCFDRLKKELGGAP